LVLGDDELASGLAEIKNMQTGESTSVRLQALQEDLRTVL